MIANRAAETGRAIAGRAWGWLCGLATVAIVAGPPLLMAAAIGVDRGRDGRPRLSAFPLALAASDPTVWEASRNSLIVAAIVAAGSLWLGVISARAASGRFRGCGPLLALATAPGWVPPALAAVGWVGFLPLLPPSPVGPASPWFALIWVELAWGVPRVALAVLATLRGLDPSWEDAARLAGASSRSRWNGVTWPLVRPVAARAAADVFFLTLFEPGAPLVLGVRRTLGFQAIQAATFGDDLARAAALGGIAWMLALAGRGLIRAWGGASWPVDTPASSRVKPRTSWARSLASAATLLIFATFGGVSLIGLIATAIGWPRPGLPAISPFRELLVRAETRELITHGLVLGLIAAMACSILSGGLRRHPRRRRLAMSARLVPPLVFGIGVAVAPELLRGLASVVPKTYGLAWMASKLDRVAEFFDPYASPWPAMIAAVSAARLSGVARWTWGDRDEVPEARVEVARTLGASAGVAWRTVAARRWAGASLRILAWTAVLAALDASPALVLSPTSAARPLVPGMVAMLGEPRGPRQASALAVIVLGLMAIVRMASRPPRE